MGRGIVNGYDKVEGAQQGREFIHVLQRIDFGVLGPLAGINTDDFPDIDQFLGLFRLANEQNSDPRSSIDGAVIAIDDLLAKMERILLEMEQRKEFNEVVRMLQEILEQQKDVRERTVEEQERSLLITYCDDSDPSVRASVAKALAHLDPPLAEETYLRLAEDPSSSVRRRMARVAGVDAELRAQRKAATSEQLPGLLSFSAFLDEQFALAEEADPEATFDGAAWLEALRIDGAAHVSTVDESFQELADRIEAVRASSPPR